MRIIGGKHRGRRITTLPGDATRPTSDRVREALFGILESKYRIDGARVLDGCAGSGALGLEALSRGAAHVTFFDTDRRALQIVTENIATLDVASATDARSLDVTKPPNASQSEACSIVFLDAPYRTDIAERALPALAAAGWFAVNALIVVETERAAELPLPEGFSENDCRRYGSTELHFVEYSG
ncbi:MAG: 16S rRNA (guanine(966)-N(2))-methyltransferase RsmD [Alphaproteobacteria bacterium]|nr:16S rRNA (guanine(966)-N(2))-methyltransferase RsmD [Alphaproteobacteria bacterium]